MPTSRRPSRATTTPQNDTRPVVSVLGVGQMGLVCAGLLVAQESVREAGEGTSGGSGGRARPVRVMLWGHNPDEAGRLAQTRRSPRLEGFVLPDHVQVVLKDAPAVSRS